MTATDQSATAPPTRRYDVDALRVLAFGLLIIYHVCMFYVADWGWHVKSSHLSETLQLPMTLLNQWRMPLIFLVSGIALSFVVDKYSRGELAKRRLWRLLIPLTFGMAVVVPPQAYYQALSNAVIEPGYGAFLLRYFTFQQWPEGAFDGSDYGLTWNHLWYLPYLLAYTLTLIVILPLFRGLAAGLLDRFRGLRGLALITVPTLPLLIYGLTVFPVFGSVSHNFITDGYAHAMYFTIFVYGFIIGRDAGLWRELARMRWLTLGLGITTFVALQVANAILPDDATSGQELLQLVLIYLNRWVWLLLVLGWAHQWLNRPMRWLPYANRAVYPWYVLHQTITVVAGYHLAQMGLGPVLEPTLVLAVTFVGCYAGYEFLIRRVPFLQPLFGVAPSLPAPAAETTKRASDANHLRQQAAAQEHGR